MKTLQLVIAVILAFCVNISSYAQGHEQNQVNMSAAKTESFKVLGNCNMCKARIEKAARTTGVTSANWDEKTQLLTLTYDPSKTSRDSISKLVASAGHDTEKFRAPDEVYASLPGCCHYDRSRK